MPVNIKKLSNPNKKTWLMVAGVAVLFGAVGTILLANSNAATACNAQTFSITKNSRHTCVGYIQELLNWHLRVAIRSSTILNVDSSFGPRTKAATIEVQRYGGLVQDGIVDSKTWAQLCSYYRGGTPPASYPLATALKAGCAL